MSQPAITVSNLGKRFHIGTVRHDLLRDRLAHLLRAPWRRWFREPPSTAAEFWALRDVSFEIQSGEVLGVIGPNGAGKSTLLKILSRITEPTTGRIAIRGRIASLLEVGTGFHPELTGRENVFLNGAILGMTRLEVRAKFDEIVAFAEVERFLDTPVKHYSSGMYVRLAFAVAAHLEPEILIVDEVLAVGDAAFQKKCLGKMQNVAAQHGRTVIFVSHQLASVAQLTKRALLLHSGKLVFAGPTGDAIGKYLNANPEAPSTVFAVADLPRVYASTQAARILALRYERKVPQFGADEAFIFVATIRAAAKLDRLRVNIAISSSEGTPIGGCFSPDRETMRAGEVADFRVTLPRHYLAPGHYYCNLAIGRGSPNSGHEDYDVVAQTMPFEVLPPANPDGTVSRWQANWGRVIYPELRIEPAGP